MTTTTINLNLILYDSGSVSDQSGSFLTWQNDMSGSNNSNMIKIDNWSGSMNESIVTSNSSASGSMSSISGSIITLSGSIVTMNTDVLTQYLKIHKIDEKVVTRGYSDSPYLEQPLDFNNIPQTYTHLLIIGIVDTTTGVVNVEYIGCDFNGDANTSNYTDFTWRKSSVNTTVYEEFHDPDPYPTACINLGTIFEIASGSYISPVFAIIPNYSSSGTMAYKSAMSLISSSYTPDAYPSGKQFLVHAGGGTWLSKDPITRIRIFAKGLYLSGRYYFGMRTKISLYGIA